MNNTEAADQLWGIHIEGPDDVYAMPSQSAAQEHCDILNAEFARRCIPLRAVVIKWEHSAEDHAQDMRDHLREGIGHDY